MNKLYVLVGLPASGKSTYAREKLANEETIVLSSDQMRKELLGDEKDQTNNDLVFRTLYARAKQYLQDGKNVVIDATNINIKARRSLLSNFVKMPIERIAVVFATPFETCIERDKWRERTVGEEVIKKFLYRFEIPMEYEGFDKVDIVNGGYYSLNRFIDEMDNYDQKNPHHIYTVGKHCAVCGSQVEIRTDYEPLIIASLWHDIGKCYTQTFDESGIAHYYSHHNVGAYLLMCCNFFERETLFYVNFHMNPFFWKEPKTHEKYKKLFGENLYNNLMLLNECDKIASGTRRNDNENI